MRRILHIKNSPSLLSFYPIVPQHPTVDSRVLAFESQLSLRGNSFQDEVVVAVRAILVRLLKLLGVFPESLFALLAGEGLQMLVPEWQKERRGSMYHFSLLEERVVFCLGVAFCAVKPLAACNHVRRYSQPVFCMSTYSKEI